jgi:hypothetical protein
MDFKNLLKKISDYAFKVKIKDFKNLHDVYLDLKIKLNEIDKSSIPRDFKIEVGNMINIHPYYFTANIVNIQNQILGILEKFKYEGFLENKVAEYKQWNIEFSSFESSDIKKSILDTTICEKLFSGRESFMLDNKKKIELYLLTYDNKTFIKNFIILPESTVYDIEKLNNAIDLFTIHGSAIERKFHEIYLNFVMISKILDNQYKLLAKENQVNTEFLQTRAIFFEVWMAMLNICMNLRTIFLTLFMNTLKIISEVKKV